MVFVRQLGARLTDVTGDARDGVALAEAVSGGCLWKHGKCPANHKRRRLAGHLFRTQHIRCVANVLAMC